MDRYIYNIRSYGAIGNGCNKDTLSIQAAINNCSENGGGIVYFPSGTYLCGTLWLKSNITIYLDVGATLMCSDDRDEFAFIEAPKNVSMKHSRCGLIYGENITNVSIKGEGKISGQDKLFWTPMDKIGESWNSTPPRYWAKEWRPMMILLEGCSNVKIEGITIEHSPCYAGWIIDCENVNIDKVNVLNDFYGPNTDGFHFSSCRCVSVCNSFFLTGDDSIAIDGNGVGVSESYTISNCSFNTSVNVFRIYTGLDPNMDIKDSAGSVVRNISINNCSVINAAGVINITAENGVIENIAISNISMTLAQEGTSIFLMSTLGKIRNVLISNIVSKANGACTIIGTEDSYIEEVTLNNIRFAIEPKKKLYELEIPDPIPNYSQHHFAPNNIYIRYADGIKIVDTILEWENTHAKTKGSAVKCMESNNIELRNFAGRQAGETSDFSAIHFENVTNSSIDGCKATLETNSYVYLSGSRTNRIWIKNNDFGFCKGNPLVFSSAVLRECVIESGNID